MASVREGLPFEKYVALPGTHASALKDILVSPRLYRQRQEAEREDRDSLRLGRAGHTAILEPDRFLLEYAVYTAKDDAGKQRIRRGKDWDAFCEVNADKTILTVPQYELALKMRDAARAHPVASRLLLERGRNEITIEWEHERTGTQCKSRVDRLCSALVDIKTTRDPSPQSFSRDAGKYGYALQLAFYAEACRVAGLGELPVKIIAAQNCEPYDVVVYDLDEEILSHGREQYELALMKLVNCNESQEWPGVAPNEEVTLRLPAWMSPSLEDEPVTIDGVALF